MTHDRLRLGLIGAGWISSLHLEALDRLDRTTLVGVASARLESAAGHGRASGRRRVRRPRADARRATARRRLRRRPAVGGDRDLRGGHRARDPVPHREAAGGHGRGGSGARRGGDRASAGSWSPSGYHLRSLEQLPEVRARLAANPARLVTARWTDSTPPPAWWRRGVDGGGQVIEQATHLYDLARLLVGEAEVVGAASLHETPATPPGTDVADASRRRPALRLRRGRDVRQHAPPVERPSSTSRSPPTGCCTTIRAAGSAPEGWEVELRDGDGRDRPPARARPVRDPGRDLPRRRRRRRPVGGGLDLRRRPAHRPPDPRRGRRDGRSRLTPVGGWKRYVPDRILVQDALRGFGAGLGRPALAGSTRTRRRSSRRRSARRDRPSSGSGPRRRASGRASEPGSSRRRSPERPTPTRGRCRRRRRGRR